MSKKVWIPAHKRPRPDNSIEKDRWKIIKSKTGTFIQKSDKIKELGWVKESGESKNETSQYDRFEAILMTQKNFNDKSIFYKFQEVKKLDGTRGYDALITLEDGKKMHVQLTTISTNPIKIGGKWHHYYKHINGVKEKHLSSEKVFFKQLKKSEKKTGIKRYYTINDNLLTYRDFTPNYECFREMNNDNFEINIGMLRFIIKNAIVEKQKKWISVENSMLVILDLSHFTIKFHIHSNVRDNYLRVDSTDFLIKLVKEVINENKDENKFDEICCFLHKAKNKDVHYWHCIDQQTSFDNDKTYIPIGCCIELDTSYEGDFKNDCFRNWKCKKNFEDSPPPAKHKLDKVHSFYHKNKSLK